MPDDAGAGAGAEIQVRFGRQSATLRSGDELAFEVETDEGRFPFAFACGESPCDLRTLAWRDDAPRIKKPSDYTDRSGLHDPAEGLLILRNKTALPFARLVRRDVRLASEEEMWSVWERFVRTGEGWSWRDALLVAPRDGAFPSDVPSFQPLDEKSGGADDVRVRYEGTDAIACDVVAAAPAWLHVAVTDDGNWEARVNGIPAPIVRANGPFLAVPITSAGHHAVRLAYRPWSFTLGLWTTGVTALALLGLLAFGRLRRRSRAVGSAS